MPTTALTRAGRGPREGGRSGDDRVARVDSVQRLLLDGSNTHRIRIRRRRALLFTVAFSGPILFWLPASTEPLCYCWQAAALYAIARGLAGAAGQCALFALCYCFGERLAARWPWLRRRISMSGIRLGQERRLRDDDNRGRGRLFRRPCRSSRWRHRHTCACCR